MLDPFVVLLMRSYRAVVIISVLQQTVTDSTLTLSAFPFHVRELDFFLFTAVASDNFEMVFFQIKLPRLSENCPKLPVLPPKVLQTNRHVVVSIRIEATVRSVRRLHPRLPSLFQVLANILFQLVMLFTAVFFNLVSWFTRVFWQII